MGATASCTATLSMARSRVAVLGLMLLPAIPSADGLVTGAEGLLTAYTLVGMSATMALVASPSHSVTTSARPADDRIMGTAPQRTIFLEIVRITQLLISRYN